MYSDPSHIKSERINLSVTPAVKQVIFALAQLNGVQPTAFALDLALSALEREFGVDVANIASDKQRTGT